MTLVLIVALQAASLSFGADVNVSPRPQTDKSPSPPISILSIIPSQGEPGIMVTLFGTGFTPKTTVFLANIELLVKVADQQQISFDIPDLEPGLYALYLKREDGTFSRPYNFSVLPLKPVAFGLAPDTITSCASSQDREVTIAGRNFIASSQVMFDGAAIKSRFSSPEYITFITPKIAGGLHQVQVKNSEDAISGVLGLVIDDRPEITGVTIGDELVNFYNLIIEGRNFQQNSVLMVMEDKAIDQSGAHLTLDIKRVSSSTQNAIDREQIMYVNCNRIIYQRFPYSTTPKNLKLQVLNPANGSESSLVSVSSP